MPNKTTSPFATQFKKFVSKGVPCSNAVQTIAWNTGKTVPTIYNSLWKAGLCTKQKINNTWIYWPTNARKSTPTNTKNCQANLWQAFVEWCIASGNCTTKQLKNYTGNPKNFMNFCRTFFNNQWNTSTGNTPSTTAWFTFNGKNYSWKPTPTKTNRRTSSKRRTTTSKYSGRTTSTKWATRSTPTWTKSKSWKSTSGNTYRTSPSRSFKFPTVKPRTTSRRYRHAA